MRYPWIKSDYTMLEGLLQTWRAKAGCEYTQRRAHALWRELTPRLGTYWATQLRIAWGHWEIGQGPGEMDALIRQFIDCPELPAWDPGERRASRMRYPWIDEVAEDLIAWRDRKGWHKTTWESLPVRLCSMNAELHELDQALRKGDAIEARFEVADVLMYAITVLVDLSPGNWTLRSPKPLNPYLGLDVLLSRPRAALVSAFECWRRDARTDIVICLEIVIRDVLDVCDALKVDPEHAIRDKLARNQKRDVRNGGKHPQS